MTRKALEIKVGVFVLLAVVLLSFLVIKAGDWSLEPSYSVRFIFSYVSGIDKGSPVRLAGVDVGEVTGINVLRSENGETRVEVEARIDQGALIEEDAEVRINSLGFISEKYIEILPGTTGAHTIKNGDVLVGKSPIVLEKITESGDRLISKIEYTVDNINNVVADKEFQTKVKGTFNNSEAVMKNLQQSTEDLKEAARSAKIVLGRMRDGEGTIGRLLKDDTIAKDLEAFVKDIKAHPWKLLKRG